MRSGEEIGQKKKKLYFIWGIIILVVSVAAFSTGKMFNSQASPLGLSGLGDRKGFIDVSINLIPAKEIPKTPPVLVGPLASRKDKIIVLQSASLKTGGAGIIMHKGENRSVSPSSNMNYGEKVEIVITNETVIYCDTTRPGELASGENQTDHQTVEASNLDDFNSRSEVMVWGRKSGDRIIAEVLL